jgi:hypothetical protein
MLSPLYPDVLPSLAGVEVFPQIAKILNSLPFKGRVGWGWVSSAESMCHETHPHPSLPLEGEGAILALLKCG